MIKSDKEIMIYIHNPSLRIIFSRFSFIYLKSHVITKEVHECLIN